MSSTGNVNATNIFAAVISNAASFTGTLISVTGNINGANVITGVLSASGTITSTNATVLQGLANSAGIELGNSSAVNTPFIDFHTSGNAVADYDSRIIASGGSGNSTSGTGTLSLVGATVVATGLVTAAGGMTAQTVAAQGFGMRVVAATTDANATIQFTNTAQNAQWATITSNAVNSLLLNATTTQATGSFITPGTITVNSGAAATAIINGASNAVGNIGSSSTYFNRLFAQATTALYADLAEMYVSDAEYQSGTVVVFGGNQEVTISTTDSSRRVAGVISTNPAHVMNSGLQGEFTVAVALSGRVPTLVSGPVAKGDMMVSAGYGRARAEENPVLGSVIGKALEDFNGVEGTIEIVVGRL